MEKITGGLLLIRALKAHGIHRLFTIPGAPLFPVYEACLNEGVEVLTARHESGLIHIAEGWSRATGKPSVVLVSPGPGHANAIPGISIAFAECSPVIVLSGIDVPANLGRGGRQELPQVQMCAPITRWSALLSSGKRIPEYVAKAFRIAVNGMPGPVHISITTDTFSELVEVDETTIPLPANTQPNFPAQADHAFVEQALDLLSKAERPLIVAGVAAFWSHAGDLLRQFVETVKIPLMTVEQARGLVPDNHPYCFGDGYGTVNQAAQLEGRVDVLLLLGDRLDHPLAYGSCFGSAKIIHVCPDANEIGKNHPVECGVAGDVRAVIAQLLEAAKNRDWNEPAEWVALLRQTRIDQAARVERMSASTEPGVHPARIALAVESLLDERSILAFDGGDFSSWARYSMTARRSGGWLASTVLGHLGVGLPYAMGAKLAFPEEKVVVLTGDGALGFSVMELETAVRYHIPVVVVVANDAAFGVEVYYQQKWFGPDRVVGTELTNTRWDLLAESLGAHGEFVETPEQLRPALERAFASGKPACINVISQRMPSPQTQTFSRIYLLKRAHAQKKAST
ncbi:MAG: thiamine pyrophosphate-binding protein [Terracidiphilus sp.]|jgi:acetolactate synthase-1/2/3 large subunit